MLAEHDEDVPVPAKVQVPDGVKVTVPVGALAVPAAVSVTVAVHEVAWLTKIGEGVHVTLVVVDLRVTVTDVAGLVLPV